MTTDPDGVYGATSSPQRSRPGEAATPSCPRCHATFGSLRHSARFCPRCGTSLESTARALPVAPPPPASIPKPSLIPGEPARAAAWLRLRQQARDRLPIPALLADDEDSHSLMLLGYANAMYRLGSRYERALGSERNVDEAIRCYFKAAKLGNADALARLAPQCVGEPKSSV